MAISCEKSNFSNALCIVTNLTVLYNNSTDNAIPALYFVEKYIKNVGFLLKQIPVFNAVMKN